MNQTAHLGEILPCCDPIIRGSAYCWYVTVKPSGIAKPDFKGELMFHQRQWQGTVAQGS